uniref:Uncharacterized protein n=2 Tax=Neobodo designis TaxID=312471 RepID=A0A7S1W513_NEODS
MRCDAVRTTLLVIAAVFAASVAVAQPQWPQAGTEYEMVFAWRMQYPGAVAAEGPMIWRGNGSGAVFFHIVALGFKQLQVGGTVWNWHTNDPAHPDCYAWRVPYDLNVAWFDNASLAFATPGCEGGSGSAPEQTWVGSLATPGSPLGVPFVSYVATLDPTAPANVSRIPTRYSPVGILRPMPGNSSTAHHRGSEILERQSISFGPQDPANFVLPEYCHGV